LERKGGEEKREWRKVVFYMSARGGGETCTPKGKGGKPYSLRPAFVLNGKGKGDEKGALKKFDV